MTELKNYDKANLYMYEKLIGKLIYLEYGTKPDIIFIIGHLSRHNADPRKDHLQAPK